MSTVKIYQFMIYDITNDELRRSRRWGTREGIKAAGGKPLEKTETEIDTGLVGGEVDGLTVRNFNPHAQLRG